GQRLLNAEEPDNVAAIRVIAQRAVRQRAGVGRQHRPGSAAGRRDLAVALADRPALVLDLPQQLAVPVLEHGAAKVAAEPEPDLAELVRRVALDGQPAEKHEPAAILQLAGNLGERAGEAEEGEALARGPLPRDASRLG